MTKILHETMFWQFLRHPLSTGAVCASSPALCQAMLGGLGLNGKSIHAVAELGPGTGAVTECIAASLSQGTPFFAVELNSDVIPGLKKRLPGLQVFNDSAANLRLLMERQSIPCVDVIFSGLPWASFPDKLQEELLSAILDVLPSHGKFITYAYVQGVFLPRGRGFRRRLHSLFSSVEQSSVVWKNIPPAFVYRCTK